MGLTFDEIPDGGEYGGTHGNPYGEFKEGAHVSAFPADTVMRLSMACAAMSIPARK